MKITLIGPVYPYRGGIAHYTTMLASKLQAARHTVQLVSFRRQYPSWLYPGETDRDTSRQPLVFPAQYKLDPLYPWTWLQTAGAIAKSQPDLVIIQWWTTFWAPALGVIARLLRARKIRVLFLIHNVMPHEARFWDRALSRFALAPAHAYIALSAREAARLRQMLPDAGVQVSPLPVYNMFPGGTLTRAEARAQLGLPPDAPVVLFFGIVRPYKGLRYLLQALNILKTSRHAAHLVVAGEFWEPLSEYKSMIQTMDLSDRVHIFNRYIPNEDIPVFFQAADLYAAPYVDGTQSASAKLALAFSLPMVLTRCVVDETLAAQENVWQVAERDPQGLADGIRSALENSAVRPPVQAVDDWARVVRIIEGM